MIDTVLNLLFRCPHRRLTRPITRMSKPGVADGDPYVVCLDCGKQFTYNWQEMRVGKPVPTSATAGVLHPDMPAPPKTKLKYALLGSAIPLAVVLAKTFKSKRQPKARSVPPPDQTPGK